MSNGFDDLSLLELFRMEADEQIAVLRNRLLEVESGHSTAAGLEALMRASHSLKGAARIIGLDAIVHLTHAMEDRFVAAQAGHALDSADVDRMLRATDWLEKLQTANPKETEAWLAENTSAIEALAASLASTEGPTAEAPSAAVAPSTPEAKPAGDGEVFRRSQPESDTAERSIRMSSGGFDRILAFSSHMLVASRQFVNHSEALERNKHALVRAHRLLADADEMSRISALQELERQIAVLDDSIADLDTLTRSNERAAERLHRAVLAGRLRPFSEGITGVSRLVRDTARNLGKTVVLEVIGEGTRVDRDILERLEAPISHLVTNAIDHGIETQAERAALGKAAEARIKIHARHENGRLVITVQDDGRGIHRDRLRETILRKNLVNAETAEGLSDHELLEFLFLPGFSTANTVSEISGRGVGLNVVQSMVQEAGGSVTVTSEPGEGTTFRLTLPVTRSVIKVIRLQVDGESYAVPLVRIDKVVHMEPQPSGEEAEERYSITLDGESVPVVTLNRLLGLSTRPLPAGPVPMLLSGGVAFAVDRLVDEIELPVRRIDRRLGKIPGVSAASLDEDGLPLLILDVEDLLHTAREGAAAPSAIDTSLMTPRILIVDDSHTVREMERRLLDRAGYTVATAQNGQEAWNLLRLNDYDLLISDVDMPQMNGIELVAKVRDNPRLARMPVIILSYKDSEEDKRRGLDAGADYYLTKGAFQNNTFLQAVVDLIGTAEPMTGDDKA